MAGVGRLDVGEAFLWCLVSLLLLLLRSGRQRKLPLLDLLRGRSYKYIDSGSWSFAGGRAERAVE